MKGVAVAFVFAAVAACHSDTAGPPPPPPGWPQADVRLVTDDMGITHVFAASDGDAFFGNGYAMARDRLFQMEVYRRLARGTSAELFGASSINTDLGARAFDFARWAGEDLARTRAEHPADAVLVDAWIAGVNARIAEVRSGVAPRPYGLGKGELDFVPDDWTMADPFAVGKLLAFGTSNTLDQDILATAVDKLAPDFAASVPFLQPAYDVFTLGHTPSPGRPPRSAPRRSPVARLAPGAGELSGFQWAFFRAGDSNNWAVDGAHSYNGRPLLAGDPHQVLTSPSRLWPIHLSSADGGGAFDVIGFAFPGTPGVQIGHNAHVGWTLTTNFADVMDIWGVKTTSGRKAVRLGGREHRIVPRNEVIRVRAADGHLDAQSFTVEDVPGYGVLLPDPVLPIPRILLTDSDAILFNWTGFRATRELSAYLGVDRALDVDALDVAVDLMDVGAVNFVSADRAHIDYRVHSLVPDRGDPSSHPMPWHLLDGSDARGLWTGAVLGPDRLPHWRDPARGFLVTANNDPWGFTADGDVENDPFYYGAFFANGFRAARIEQSLAGLLEKKGKVTAGDLEALQDDTHSVLSDTALPLLAKAIGSIGQDPALSAYAGRTDLVTLAQLVGSWDGSLDRTRGEPIVFAALAWFSVKRAFSASLPDFLLEPVAAKSPPFLLGMLQNVLAGRFPGASGVLAQAGGVNALLVGALDDTSAWLLARFGTEDPRSLRWGDFNQATFVGAYGHLQDPAPEGVDGGSDSVKVCESAFFQSGQPLRTMVANEASVYRMVTTFGEDGTPEASLDFQRGTREDPADPHFGDQNQSWVRGAHSPLAFREADVEARSTAHAVLPALQPKQP